MNMQSSLTILLIFIALLYFVYGNIISMDSSNGLYDSVSDDVEIFNKTNFKSIYGQDRAAIVEFYAQWCVC